MASEHLRFSQPRAEPQRSVPHCTAPSPRAPIPQPRRQPCVRRRLSAVGDVLSATWRLLDGCAWDSAAHSGSLHWAAGAGRAAAQVMCPAGQVGTIRVLHVGFLWIFSYGIRVLVPGLALWQQDGNKRPRILVLIPCSHGKAMTVVYSDSSVCSVCWPSLCFSLSLCRLSVYAHLAVFLAFLSHIANLLATSGLPPQSAHKT